MQFIAFILIYPLLWMISMLPFRLLYLLSDFFFVIMYHVVGYRKKTVRKNLLIALPHLTEKERLEIEKKSYHHLCDLFLEMIKTLTISDKEMNKRFVTKNIEVLKEVEAKGKSIAIMTGHYASYEWSISMNKSFSFQGFAIYKKIANSYFDKLVRDIRSKFGATLITTKETIPTIEENFKNGHLGIYGFASDQSPKVSKAFHWGNFFGVSTPLQTGAEMLSKRFDMNLLFMRIRKVKRGYYEAELEILSENPTSVPDYEITDLFMKKLEDLILEAPEYYLWTHKRFKYVK